MAAADTPAADAPAADPAAVELTAEEQAAQKLQAEHQDALDAMTKAFGHHTARTLTRFLIARDWDVEKATAMLTATDAWRSSFGFPIAKVRPRPDTGRILFPYFAVYLYLDTCTVRSRCWR